MFVWELLIVALLILVNGFFSMSEMALVSSRRVRLRQMAEGGNRGARAALVLAEDPGQFLSTVQIGITLVGILTGAYGGTTLAAPLAAWLRQIPLLAGSADSVAIALVVAAITYLSLIIGELVPKRIALNHAERIASFVARPMRLVATSGAPLVWLLGVSTEAVLRLLGQQRRQAATVTEEEVKALISEGTAAGVFDPAEKKMIYGVLRLADRSVRAVMTPRPEVVWLDLEDDPETLRTRIAASGHSYLPVSRGGIDEIVGIVKTKDLLDRALRGEPFDVAACLHQPLVVHDGTSVLTLLEMFHRAPIHLAIVVDEYGSFEGIVTPTDILTAIAGAVPEPGRGETGQAVRREDGSWLIDAMMPIDEVEGLLGRSGMRGDGDYQTLAGFILWKLGRVPKVADSFVWNGLRFEIVDMDGRRIDKVLVMLQEPPDEAGSGI